MSEDELCFVCGKEPLHEDGQCPACWAETQRLMANPPHTAEEKALAELRAVIDTLRARNRKLNWELANEALVEKRLEQIWQHFTWMDETLERAAKI